MKKHKTIAIIFALAVLCAMPAMASGLTARYKGGAIEVAWQVAAGDCELTVYQSDWPICVRNVSGGNGRARIPVGDGTGRYSVRLRTSEGCYTAEVDVAEPAKEPKPDVTQRPTEVPTAAPTKVPVEVPAVTPTNKPTEAPTAQPAQTATPKPTHAPKQTATPKPTQAPVSVSNREDLATQVLTLVNEERASRGLGALRMDSELTRAACVRAGEIAQSFSHTRPDGTSWSTVSMSAYGENIAKGQQTAEKVVAAWMTSTGHRENILRASYGSIGICAYKANGVMYWVQLFGK